MKAAEINYARILYERRVCDEALDEALEVCRQVPDVVRILDSPVVHMEEKERLVDKVFPQELRSIIKVMARHRSIYHMPVFFKIYRRYRNAQMDVLDARLVCVNKPTDEQIEGLKARLAAKYNKSTVNLNIKIDPIIIGGFVVKVGDEEFDYSLARQIENMKDKLVK